MSRSKFTLLRNDALEIQMHELTECERIEKRMPNTQKHQRAWMLAEDSHGETQIGRASLERR